MAPRQQRQTDTAHSEMLNLVQQQMEELLERIQQDGQKTEDALTSIRKTDQQREHTQQQTQDQIDQILQTLQQMNRQHIEEAEQITQQLNLHTQQWEEALQTSQQNQQEQTEAVQQMLQRLDQESLQQIQQIRQQMQQQIDKVLNNVQRLFQKAEQPQQQHEPSLQQLHETGSAKQDRDRLLPERTRQDTSQVFDHFIQAQYRVQAVLAQPSPKLPVPRLFIILPAPTAAVKGQGGSPSMQFRLHFLCECGSHTMDKDCSQPHEVHLANHPGYDLNNQEEFLNKYGSYLLTMMYMVKYGTKTRGLVVPPLLGLNVGEGESIGQLIDDAISHLEETATGCFDADTTAPQNLDATELANLKSYLKTGSGQYFSGGLSQMKIQKAHYAWICSEHLRECYESTLQQLRYNTISQDAVWYGNEVKVKSGETTQLIYDNLSRLFRIQRVENWRSITDTDLRLDSYHSTSGSTTDTLSGLDDLESVSLDFGRFTMSARDIFRDQIKDVIISIRDPGAPTLDDLEFIQQCPPAALAISKTQQKDDNHLAGIFHHNLSITSLRIDCDMNRFIAVIDLVCTTREKILQSGIWPTLRMLELVHPEINVKVSFDEESPVLDTAPRIDLGNCQSYVVEPDVYNSIRQHGLSAVTFVVPASFSDHFTKLLDESIQKNESRIARIDITPTSITTEGLYTLNQAIDKLQGLAYFRLCLENLSEKTQEEKALQLLERHKGRLTSLHLGGAKVEDWLPKISGAFTYGGLPLLEELFVESRPTTDQLSHTNGQQIVRMASRPLKVLGVDLDLQPQDWEELVKAINLSTLEELHFNPDFIRHNQLKLLVDRIADSGVSPLPMRILDFKGNEYRESTRELLTRIQEKAPHVRIQCNI
ncbi:hypothetical protein BGX34_007810 [Mortierella sp. NVP85]|nr:hypothetical protein BGX34_007810 [Mortierella sp. NVP85]